MVWSQEKGLVSITKLITPVSDWWGNTIYDEKFWSRYEETQSYNVELWRKEVWYYWTGEKRETRGYQYDKRLL